MAVDSQSSFYPQESVDRTRYTSCVGVALLALLIWLVGAWGLWQIAQYVKRQQWSFLPHFSTPNLPSSSQADQKVQSLLQTEQQNTEQKVQSEVQKAAGNAVQQQSKTLQQYLH